jgi:hypothetical protein
MFVALLAIPSGLRLAAQNQPQAKKESPRHAVVAAKYNFLIGSGLLCESDDSTACPAVAETASEKTIEISGAGMIDLSGKSVVGAGAFTQKTRGGYIVSTGVWTTRKLVSFQSYGLAPGELQHVYPKLRELGRSPMVFGRMPGPVAAMMAGPTAAGGVAVIRIRLLPDAGSPRDAVLQVNCGRGNASPDETRDGIKLAISGGGPNFDEEVGGRTLFLLQGPGPDIAWTRLTGAGAER